MKPLIAPDHTGEAVLWDATDPDRPVRLLAERQAPEVFALLRELLGEADALAGLVAKIEALADEWERDEAYSCVNAAECVRCVSFQRAVIRLRALIPADAATALDQVRAEAKAEGIEQGRQEAREGIAAAIRGGRDAESYGTESGVAWVGGWRTAVLDAAVTAEGWQPGEDGA